MYICYSIFLSNKNLNDYIYNNELIHYSLFKKKLLNLNIV